MTFTKYVVIYLIFGFFLLVLTSSCHKYADDPFISLRSPFKRITRYQWSLNKLLVNGQDSISLFHDTLGRPYTMLAWFHANNNGYFLDDGIGTGSWSIGNKLTTCYEKGYGVLIPYAIFPNGCVTWDIIELYEKKLTIKRILNGKTYEAYFTGEATPN